MIVYDIEVFCDDDEAPGLKPVTDAVYEAMRSIGCRTDLMVEVKGPPELTIGLRFT